VRVAALAGLLQRFTEGGAAFHQRHERAADLAGLASAEPHAKIGAAEAGRGERHHLDHHRVGGLDLPGVERVRVDASFPQERVRVAAQIAHEIGKETQDVAVDRLERGHLASRS
jgi:hypothetical protein